MTKYYHYSKNIEIENYTTTKNNLINKNKNNTLSISYK
ncbi:hypothetical protein M2372_000531 [Chryseobacterium sp. BIGb0232]|nr:hypothetical protein [Chryseobacterium sp. BIGb0232]ROS20039.1 hypothetical protein EDF65_0740 [Chryseobacterium nakagawai]